MTDTVSDSERDDFFRENFGITEEDKPFKEHRKNSGGYLVAIAGQPIRPKAEYRTGSLARMPRPRHWTPDETAAWINALQHGGWPED